MRKQEYFDMGIEAGLTPSQIEGVLCRVMEISRESLFTLGDISSKYIYEVQQAFYKFRSGIPEEYATGRTNFYARDFVVDERVLIPRIETEVLVKQTLRIMNEDRDIKNTIYVDVGTGSGCIAVSILQEIYPLTFQKAFALDISSGALEVAKKNIESHCNGKLDLRQGNLLEGVFHEESLKGKHLCVTANLPYIKDGDYENMGASTIAHEPDIALYGGKESGFELYRELIKQCFQLKEIHKLADIDMFIEIGYDQNEVSKNTLEELGLSFEYFPDSATIARVIHIWGF